MIGDTVGIESSSGGRAGGAEDSEMADSLVVDRVVLVVRLDAALGGASVGGGAGGEATIDVGEVGEDGLGVGFVLRFLVADGTATLVAADLASAALLVARPMVVGMIGEVLVSLLESLIEFVGRASS